MRSGVRLQLGCHGVARNLKDLRHVQVALFHNEDAGDGTSVGRSAPGLERQGHELVHVVERSAECVWR